MWAVSLVYNPIKNHHGQMDASFRDRLPTLPLRDQIAIFGKTFLTKIKWHGIGQLNNQLECC